MLNVLDIIKEIDDVDLLIEEGDRQQDLRNYGRKKLEDNTKYENALICYDKSIKIDSTHSPAWERKGQICHKLENYSQAISCYDKVIEIDSQLEDDSSKFSVFEMWGRKGIIFDEWKKPEESKMCFSKASVLSGI